jgi:hypothetical protein
VVRVLFVEFCFDFTSPSWPAKAVNSAVRVLFVEFCFDFTLPSPAKAVNSAVRVLFVEFCFDFTLPSPVKAVIEFCKFCICGQRHRAESEAIATAHHI